LQKTSLLYTFESVPNSSRGKRQAQTEQTNY
jgi:hypothetical protein